VQGEERQHAEHERLEEHPRAPRPRIAPRRRPKAEL
jgi:hypothetical protein